MRIKWLEEIEHWSSGIDFPLQLQIFPCVRSGKGGTTDTEKVLCPFFVIEQFVSRYAHDFYADAENASIGNIRRRERARSGKPDPCGIGFRLGKHTLFEDDRDIGQQLKLCPNYTIRLCV